ncbi:hypothetical protein E4T43_08849 [Aureobasidium subglaciale]|nr:hypothetical protein E4T43_08849 [Aureobasidium subglaciale]
MKSRTRADKGDALRLAPEPSPTCSNTKKNRTVAKSRSSQANIRSTMITIFKHKRPVWPANDLTADESQTIISTLENGDEDQKLMALFARHVITPGTKNRGSQWVSRRSLYKAFPEHIEKTGFTAKSSWKQKSAIDLGLPDLFLRGVDDQRAILTPHDNVHHAFEDSGRPPTFQALTDDEHQWLEQRSKPCQHGSHPHTHPSLSIKRSASAVEQKPIPVGPTQDEHSMQIDDDRDEAITPVSKRLRSAKDKEPFSSMRSISDKELIMIDSDEDPSFKTLSNLWSACLPATISKGEESRRDQYKLSQADQTTIQHEQRPAEAASEPTPVNTATVDRKLVTKVYEILRDHPNASDDSQILPLLRQLVKAAALGNQEAIEEAHVNLLTHIVTNRTSVSLNSEGYSKGQRDITAMCIAKNFNGLRAAHAQLLVLEAQLQEG